MLRAFKDTCVQTPTAVATDSEPEVTALMQARLNELIQEDALWGQLVLWVARGTESVSFDGTHLEKRPDLSIILSGADRRFPLVAEAKILDAGSSKTAARYCENGVRRFVTGEYAWGSREALMIGYVRDGSTIDGTLRPFLSKATAVQRHRYLVESLPTRIDGDPSGLAYTRHGRDFAYTYQRPPDKPGTISVWHLWLT